MRLVIELLHAYTKLLDIQRVNPKNIITINLLKEEYEQLKDIMVEYVSIRENTKNQSIYFTFGTGNYSFPFGGYDFTIKNTEHINYP